jgi:hypothetical protein
MKVARAKRTAHTDKMTAFDFRTHDGAAALAAGGEFHGDQSLDAAFSSKQTKKLTTLTFS